MKTCLLIVLLAAVQVAPSKIPVRDAKPDASVSTGNPKIVNGQQATRGQFPHQAAVLIDSASFCGGSLIAANWVLTAGHCASGRRSFSVTLGQQSRSTAEDGKVTVVSTEKVVHEGYNAVELANDIALIKLPVMLEFTEWIMPVTLPSRSDVENNFETAAVTVSGWGKTSDSATAAADQLSFVELSVIGNRECGTYYGFEAITESMLCCGAPGGQSTCNGDSGGPLILTGSNPVKQIAVVSFVSSLGCTSGYPSGYSRLTSHLDWIQEKTGITVN